MNNRPHPLGARPCRTLPICLFPKHPVTNPSQLTRKQLRIHRKVLRQLPITRPVHLFMTRIRRTPRPQNLPSTWQLLRPQCDPPLPTCPTLTVPQSIRKLFLSPRVLTPDRHRSVLLILLSRKLLTSLKRDRGSVPNRPKSLIIENRMVVPLAVALPFLCLLISPHSYLMVK